MKIYILSICLVLGIATGCTPKSSFSSNFDEFAIKLYDNNKLYASSPLDASSIGMQGLIEMKEQSSKENTGFANSFIIVKTPIQSGIDIKIFVELNMKKLQLKLLRYKNIDNKNKKIKCSDMQYSGYITTFSYQLDKETLYEGQYFFTNDTFLYVLSLSSEDEKDIKSFVKSIDTIRCSIQK